MAEICFRFWREDRQPFSLAASIAASLQDILILLVLSEKIPLYKQVIESLGWWMPGFPTYGACKSQSTEPEALLGFGFGAKQAPEDKGGWMGGVGLRSWWLDGWNARELGWEGGRGSRKLEVPAENGLRVWMERRFGGVDGWNAARELEQRWP